MRPENPQANALLNQKLSVLDHGYVSLIDYMGTDLCIDKAARQSYLTQEEERTEEKTRGLLRFLMKHQHTSPFEQAELKFQVRVPLAIWRQWVRHRTANLNEASGRYIVLEENLYIPEIARLKEQSKSSKQGSSDKIVAFVERVQERFRQSIKRSYEDYEWLIENNLAMEVSRFVLPLSLYVDAVWKIDLHNMFHFLQLRLDEHSQEEFRFYARAIEKIVSQCFPLSWEAFVDYRRDSVTLSRMEVALIKKILFKFNDTQGHRGVIKNQLKEAGCSNREIKDFSEKFLSF